MMQRPAAWATLCLLLAACPAAEDPPIPVADAFWTAIQSMDVEKARDLSMTADERRIDALYGDRVITGFSFGETLSNETSALVETSLAVPDGSRPLVFNTHLKKFDDGWRVDAEETALDLRRAGFAAAVGDVQDALREGQRVLTEVLERSAREASEALREALDDMDRALGQQSAPQP